MPTLEIMRLQGQVANVRAARIANQIKIQELCEAIDRLKADVEISLAKEAELENTIREKEGTQS